MTESKFEELLIELRKGYGPKHVFERKEYYNMVKYLVDSDIPKLKKIILEDCSYFPKPADFLKAARVLNPYKSPVNTPIDDNKCIGCGKYASDETDPYRCVECADLSGEYRFKAFEKEEGPLADTLKRIKERLK